MAARSTIVSGVLYTTGNDTSMQQSFYEILQSFYERDLPTRSLIREGGKKGGGITHLAATGLTGTRAAVCRCQVPLTYGLGGALATRAAAVVAAAALGRELWQSIHTYLCLQPCTQLRPFVYVIMNVCLGSRPGRSPRI